MLHDFTAGPEGLAEHEVDAVCAVLVLVLLAVVETEVLENRRPAELLLRAAVRHEQLQRLHVRQPSHFRHFRIWVVLFVPLVVAAVAEAALRLGEQRQAPPPTSLRGSRSRSRSRSSTGSGRSSSSGSSELAARVDAGALGLARDADGRTWEAALAVGQAAAERRALGPDVRRQLLYGLDSSKESYCGVCGQAHRC